MAKGKAYEDGMKFAAEWIGPNGDGTMGNSSEEHLWRVAADRFDSREDRRAWIDGFYDGWRRAPNP